MYTSCLTIVQEESTGLIEARCPRPCGGLFFKFLTIDPAFYAQTKCRKCRRIVEIVGTQSITTR